MLHAGRRTAVIAVAVAGLALSACGSDPVDSTVRTGTQADSPAAPATVAAPDAGVDAGVDTGVDTTVADAAGSNATPAALQFSAPLVGGGEFDGAAEAGRPVAFWFWAPT
jgi:hypothetical protein